MSSDGNVIEFEFPRGFPREEAEAALRELTALQSVEDGDVIDRAALDVETIKAWLEVAAMTVPILTSIVSLFRSRGLKGVKMVLAGGAVVEIDQATPEGIRELAAAPKVSAKKNSKK